MLVVVTIGAKKNVDVVLVAIAALEVRMLSVCVDVLIQLKIFECIFRLRHWSFYNKVCLSVHRKNPN